MQDQREPTPATDPTTFDEDVEMRFAVAMRTGRGRRKLSQTALANELENRFGIRIDATAITRIEKRIHPGNSGVSRAIRLGEAAAIATILDIDIAAIAKDPDQSIADEIARTKEELDAIQRQINVGHERAAAAMRRLEGLEARQKRQALGKALEKWEKAKFPPELEPFARTLLDRIYDDPEVAQVVNEAFAQVEEKWSGELSKNGGLLTDDIQDDLMKALARIIGAAIPEPELQLMIKRD